MTDTSPTGEPPHERGPVVPHEPHGSSDAPEGPETRDRAAQARTAVRVFRLQRDRDISGVSGTGTVADGVRWPDGTVTIRWRGDRPSTVNWQSLADAEAVHGHGGATRIIWADTPDNGPDSQDSDADNGRTCPDTRLDDALRAQYAAALRTAPATGHTHKPGQEKYNHHPEPGDNRGHAYTYSCALCRADVEALVAAVLAVRDRHMEQLAAGRQTWKTKAEEMERERDVSDEVARILLAQRKELAAVLARVRAAADVRLADDECSESERRGYHSALADVRAALDSSDGDQRPGHDEPAGGPLTTGPINWAEDILPDTPPTTLAEAQERHRQLLLRRRESVAAVTHAWERKETAAIRDLVNLASEEGRR